MIFRLVIDAPPSKKNRQKIVRLRGRPSIMPSDEARSAEMAIHDKAVAAMGDEGVMWPTEDVHVDVVYYPRKDVCMVEVRMAGERPKGFTGRKRDISNLPDVILDALQGVVFKNDNQVSRLTVTRLLEEE